MDAVTIVIALLSASFMLCSAWSETSFTKLNNCLVDKEATFELIQNIAAAKECAKEYAAEPEVVELAQLIIDIDPSDLCGPVYIEKLTEAVEELEKVEPKWLEPKVQMMRLGSILHHCIRRAGRDCFERFEQQLLDAKDFENNLLPDVVAKKLDDSHPRELKKGEIEPRKETGLFMEALDIYFAARDQLKTELAQKNVEEKFEHIDAEREMNWYLKENGEKYIWEDAVSFVHEMSSYDDCKKFVELHESRTILHLAGQLGRLVAPFQLKTVRPKQGKTILTFLWASRYYACLRNLMMDETQIELRFLADRPDVKDMETLTKFKREYEAKLAAAPKP